MRLQKYAVASRAPPARSRRIQTKRAPTFGTLASRASGHQCRCQAKGALARDEPGRVAHGDLCSARQRLLDRPPPRAPGLGRLGIRFCDSVTNAAGPGNDLLMMVSDEELLVASVGDEEAFAVFYRRHAGPLAGFFMRRTGDAERAADLTAETFAAALLAPAVDPPRERRSWLYGIARQSWCAPFARAGRGPRPPGAGMALRA